jgi:hypothetical protein
MTAPVPCPECARLRDLLSNALTLYSLGIDVGFYERIDTAYKRQQAAKARAIWHEGMAALASPDTPPTQTYDARPSTSRCTCDAERDPDCARHNRLDTPPHEEATGA